MMFTHDELLKAVRSAGENGQPFTCGAVRDCLGMKSRDRETMKLFHRQFRTFQKKAADELEKVGKNAYRLKGPEPAQAAVSVVETPVIAHVMEEAVAADSQSSATERLVEVEIELEPADASEEESILELAAHEVVQEADEALLAPSRVAAAPIESMDRPLRMIELDFAMPELLPPAAPKRPERVETLFQAAAHPVARTWRDRGQWLGRRVAEFFGRA